MKFLLSAVLGLALAAAAASASYAATEISWWHAMGGELGKKLEEIVQNYNASQTEYHVTPTYKGSYPETMTAAIAAFRANEQPDIVQVFEVGTGTMMAAKGAIYPVYQLMKDTGSRVRSQGIPAGGRRLLHRHRRQHAVDAVQLVDADPLLQQGRVQEGRARPRDAAQDLGGRRSLLQEDHGFRRGEVRLHQRLDFMGSARESSRPGTTSRSAPTRTASAASTPS